MSKQRFMEDERKQVKWDEEPEANGVNVIDIEEYEQEDADYKEGGCEYAGEGVKPIEQEGFIGVLKWRKKQKKHKRQEEDDDDDRDEEYNGSLVR